MTMVSKSTDRPSRVLRTSRTTTLEMLQIAERIQRDAFASTLGYKPPTNLRLLHGRERFFEHIARCGACWLWSHGQLGLYPDAALCEIGRKLWQQADHACCVRTSQ